MIENWAKNQNWAKLTPFLGIITLALLFWQYSFNDPMFWALINIPLYLFHQCEEHFKPGGFKDFVNYKVLKLEKGQESLTDIKVFWINILLVWVAFVIFGALAYINIGFGLLIILFSIFNCTLHIGQGLFLKKWNPGLIIASLQFIISIYAAYFITVHAGLSNVLYWWVGCLIFSIAAHAIIMKRVMSK